MPKKQFFLFLILGLLFFYLFVVQIAAIWPFTIDDMYISLRYAKNWAHGDGLVWNINEQPVEGYSNFLFVCFATIALKLGLDPVIVLKTLGIIGLVLSSAALYGLSRFWFSSGLALVPVLWLLFYRDEMIWVSSGLETTIYQALLLLSVYALLQGLGYKAVLQQSRGTMQLGYWLAAGVLLALAGLCRPEGGMLGVLFFAIAYFNLPKIPSNPQHQTMIQESASVLSPHPLDWRHQYCFVLGSGIFVLIYGTYFLWRWHYYGLLMPNPVYCKGFAKSQWLILDKSYLRLVWPFLVLGAFWVFSKKNLILEDDRRHYFLWMPSFIYLIFLAQADPVSAMLQRLFLPAFVFLLPLTLLGIEHIINYFIRKPGPDRTLLIGVSALWVGMLCVPISYIQQLEYYSYNTQAGQQLRARLIDWLKPQVSPHNRIVLADSGMLPYFISARFEDSYCLNNKKMGQESYSLMFDSMCERTLRKKPAVIILTSSVQKGIVTYPPPDLCLNKKLASNPDYRRGKLFQTQLTDSVYRYEVYIRNHNRGT